MVKQTIIEVLSPILKHSYKIPTESPLLGG